MYLRIIFSQFLRFRDECDVCVEMKYLRRRAEEGARPRGSVAAASKPMAEDQR